MVPGAVCGSPEGGVACGIIGGATRATAAARGGGCAASTNDCGVDVLGVELRGVELLGVELEDWLERPSA